MNLQSLKFAIFLLIFPILSPSKLINAKDFGLNPTANLSTSWINNPSDFVFLNSTEFSIASFLPILFRGSSNGSQFVCGFCCVSNSKIATSTSCFFGVVIFQESHGDENYLIINNPKLIWSANRDHPFKINATLNFTSKGDMILKDSDGTFVWSTNTSSKEIMGLVLTDTGNLLIYNKNNKTVWQSFDHPTDTLVPNQKLISGQSLFSSTSTTDSSRGLFSIVIQDSDLWAYIQSNPPQNYFHGYPMRYKQYFNMENNTLTFKEPPASTKTARFMRLDSDGHLKVYMWGASDWNVDSDMFAENIGVCGYPLVCGKYGICSSGQCTCPDEANTQTTTFKPINTRHPNLGCTSSTPISCNNSKSHSLLELKNTSYLNINEWYRFVLSKRDIKLEDCKTSCLRNCSCKAAFFVYNYNMTSFSADPFSQYGACLLVSEVYSMKNTEYYGGVRAFLKVEEESPTTLNPLAKSSPTKRSSRVRIIVGSSTAAFLGAISLFAFFLILRRKKVIEEFDDLSFNQVPWMPTRFSYDDLRSITNNFFTKLGQGGFGSVFEGTLKDGTKVAVKRLDGVRHIKKSFLAEVETIGSIHHVNLVRLIGFCAEKSHGLLVYEYMPKGSLDTWIFRTKRESSLDWGPRKKIILDVAKGLAYLHEECRCKILHLDIKPQNILLDENFNAKVSDFGLAKLIEKDKSQIMTTMRGTPGYLAPEWLRSIITEKVDVYSFGVVVLEILCGRKNVDRSLPEEDMHLLTLFEKKTEEGRMEDLIDACNEDVKSHVAEIVKMMKIAKWCLQIDYLLRPTMSMVVKAIEGSLDVENLSANEFTILTTSTTIAPGARPDDAASLLLPISLSGPR